MEFGGHEVRRADPDIAGEQGIDGPLERLGRPARRHPHAHALRVRVHAGVRPAGADHRGRLVAEPLQDALHLALDGALVGLSLPAGELPAVVLGHEQNRLGVHEAEEGTSAGPPLQPT